MISTILATDMQRHFDYMSHLGELQTKVDKGKANPAQWEDKERESTRELLMALLIKAADISNVARPFDVAAKWARILMYEFARQGELESELEIPTCLFGGPPNTEDMLAAAQSQKGFLSLFGVPLFQGIAHVLPSLSSTVRELEQNQALWEEKIDEEKQRRKPDNAVERPHFGSITQDDVDTAQLEHSKSEPAAVPVDATQPISTPTKRTLPEHSDTRPSKHGDPDSRPLSTSRSMPDQDKRSSANMLSLPPPSLHPASSRRSSKDVALEHFQQLSAYAHQNLNPGSRRGSTDAGVQKHQNYPGSRRGSKDESLTTIFVASGASANRISSPSASTKKLSQSKSTSPKDSTSSGPKVEAARASAQQASPPMTGAAPSVATAYSPPLPPSSLMAGQGVTPPAALGSIPSTEDPFLIPGNWPNDVDGMHRASIQVGANEELPSTPAPPPQLGLTKIESSRTTLTEVENDDVAFSPEEPGLRESRSRTRLRGLKFWKRRRDGPDVDAYISHIESP